MRLIHLLSIWMSFALTAFASTAAPGRHLKSSAPKSVKVLQGAGVVIKDFLISDVRTQTVNNPSPGNGTNNTIPITNSPNTTLHCK